ncbi:MAG: extracellular solute-binding protein [Rhodanobacteraceae bacterium]
MQKRVWFPLLVVAAALIGLSSPTMARPAPKTLTIYAAGTLATPFQRVDAAFHKLHPDITIEPQFGGSVMMARRIADLHQQADVFASADYTVIPDVLGKAGLSSWLLGFASNAVTLAYTTHSHGANDINANNWYHVIARPGVVIGRSDPNTDPSGYQFLQMLSLADGYYHDPGLKAAVLKNAPRSAMRNTETSLISALQLGEIDYLAIYTSSAKSHGLEYVRLPADIDLGDPDKAALYAHGTARTDKGLLSGKPIIYGVTIPRSSPHPELAAEYIHFLVSPEGRKILTASGFAPLEAPLLHGASDAPASLKSGSQPWPKALAWSAGK